ncbi:hypothetical protein ATE40_008500 [Serratia surfactantfaciens]|nr:RHS repeat-associated core domain-containing protein [Serratia surfactantfaciens]AOE99285.1 hypothetical protein ATE40_008500 [Serratia surfactantfaciens]
MTDAAGNLCWSGQYDTFGKLQGQTVAGAAKRQGAQYQQPLRYAGQYQDDESGLHYNLFRYYEPEVGRFPLEVPSSVSCSDPAGYRIPVRLSPFGKRGAFS